ncbi:MAG: hypothetical protein ACT4OM_03775 [Actinomycetota bacterium]
MFADVKTVCTALLNDLVERGLDASDGLLVVIDGGKGLRAGAKEVFGNLGLIRRCRVYQRRINRPFGLESSTGFTFFAGLDPA